MSAKKIVYLIIGCIGLVLGAIGAALPLLPSFPFLLLAAFGFGKSSEKLNAWFRSSNLYKNNLETYVQGRGMTKKTKLRIIITVTILMAIGFVMMMEVPIGQITLFFVWIGHLLYFIFRVKTVKL